MPNAGSALDLYAKVEDLLGVKEAAPRLYKHYLQALRSLEFDSLLDIGCGSGDFLLALSEAFPNVKAEGIDLSRVMVSRAIKRGVKARSVDICDLSGRYDVITCVFDMLNYLSAAELEPFLHCLKARLKDGGYLLCDLNSLYGFEEVAVGAFMAEDEGRFLAIESEFEDGIYRSDFTLFEREGLSWHKSSASIWQYWHDPKTIAKLLRGRIVSSKPISLYTEDIADKEFVIYTLRN